MKLVYMADGLFLYKSYDGYVVMDENDNILKLQSLPVNLRHNSLDLVSFFLFDYKI